MTTVNFPTPPFVDELKYQQNSTLFTWGNAKSLVGNVKNALDNLGLLGFNTYTSSHTLNINDGNSMVIMNCATTNSVTVPNNTSVPFSIGTQILIVQEGVGETSFVAGSGVTIKSLYSGLTFAGQYGLACLIKKDENEWYLSGSILP